MILGVVDGSGVLYDPHGINREELLQLANKRIPISGFDKNKLSNEGFKVLVDETNIVLPSIKLLKNRRHCCKLWIEFQK